MEPTPKKNPMMNIDADAEAEIEPNHQLLPDDLVLDIVARCGTIGDAIRGAATSKSLRRGILHAPFLRHLRGFLLNDGGEHGYGDDGSPFIPTLLVGLYHQSGDPRLQPSFVPVSDGATKLLLPPSVSALPSPPNRDGDSACDFGLYLPVASRRSLLVLRRRCKSTEKEHLIERHGPHPVELTVCNPTTGERRVLPPHVDVKDMSHVLLDVDPIAAPSSSFKLLVAELSNNNPSTLYVQIFSSDSDSDPEEGGCGWGPALACPVVSRARESRFEFGRSDGNTGRPRPVVVGDTVYWLCTSRLGDRILLWRWRGGETPEACIADPPPGYKLVHPEKCLAVLPSPADAAGAGSSQSEALLGMIVIDAGEIEVWTYEKSGAGSAREWELWHRIQEEAIPRPMGFSSRWMRGAELSWFCEGSGALFLRPGGGTMSPLLFCLDTMEVSKLDAREWELNPEPEFCPYELDLLSHMLFVMKRF